MKNIVLTRIDDRLLHGQVVISWVPFLKIDEIVVVDDEYAEDEFMVELTRESAPDYIKVSVMSVEDSAVYLNQEDTGTRVLILLRNVVYLEKLMKLNFNIKRINIGGLGYIEGRKKYLNAVHMSDYELEILKNITQKGSVVEIQMLPGDIAVAVE